MLTCFTSAGVAGLTTALLLSKNPKYKIMVAAKYMPGDYNAAEYASPWAGANYLPSVHFALKLEYCSCSFGVSLRRLYFVSRSPDFQLLIT